MRSVTYVADMSELGEEEAVFHLLYDPYGDDFSVVEVKSVGSGSTDPELFNRLMQEMDSRLEVGSEDYLSALDKLRFTP